MLTINPVSDARYWTAEMDFSHFVSRFAVISAKTGISCVGINVAVQLRLRNACKQAMCKKIGKTIKSVLRNKIVFNRMH